MAKSDFPITVVIADDESAIRNGLCEIVEGMGQNVSVSGSAADGRTALDLIRELRPDLAVMDISMPELDGLEVIRIASEEKLPTKFLILSGYGDFEYAQRAIRYGVKSYFLKPLNLTEFRDIFIAQCEEILTMRENGELISSREFSTLVDSSRTLFLNQLIQRRVFKAEDISGRLRLLHLSLQNAECCVVVFSLRTDQDAPPAVSASLLSDIPEGFVHETWLYSDNQAVSIVNLSDPADARFTAVVRRAVRRLSQTGCSVRAGIGSVVGHPGLAGASYAVALEALSYRIYDTEADLFDSSVINKERPSFSSENIDYKPLIYAVTHQDRERIIDCVDTFFSSMLAVRMPPPNYVMGMCMYLLMNLQKQLELLYSDLSLDFELSYSQFYHFDSIEQLRTWIVEMLTDYSRLLSSDVTDRNGIIHTAREYILNNLDKNIRARDVAEQVHLSESYFTIYFKNKTGTNFRDYVLSARMNLAKKLLASGDVNISQIAYRIGYQDYRSFSRAFKNETGMSPSEYMASIREPR